ncbi:SGNH/GDSL hydrolase family protein [Fontibacter flavus]|uniref:SGNH/GDSL hydrolase family protein n=1 Tax=Fontibacter flavus TaxID=654838 RepID=A0ABV6FMI1_9BACT
MLWNRLSYFVELILFIPFSPILIQLGKNLRKNITRLTPFSEAIVHKSHSAKSKILIIGESTAAGVGASSVEKTISSQVFHQLKKAHDIYNLGKNGLRAFQLKKLYTKGNPEDLTKIDIVIILIGANDCFNFTSPGKFQSALSEFLEEITSIGSVKKIIIPTIPPVNQFPAIPSLIRFFLGWHRSILAREILHLKTKFSLVDFENSSEKFPKNFFAPDGIHPSDLGYELLAKQISDKIQ